MRRFLRQTILTLGAVGLLATWSEAWAVEPDFYAAREFGVALQKDYAAHRGQAIVDRLDEDTMMARVFSAYIDKPRKSPELMQLWNEKLFLSVKKQLFSLGEYKTLILQRVLHTEGARSIECLLFNDAGSFHILTFKLREAPDGMIKIIDFTSMGSSLAVTERIRQSFILLGIPSEGRMSDEETQVEMYSRTYNSNMRYGYLAMNSGNPDEAFKHLEKASADLRSTRIWHDLRNSLALSGSIRAQQDFDEELQRGGTGCDPFLCFRFLSNKESPEMVLQTLDKLIVAQQSSSFFQVIKARLLFDYGHPEEALSLARDVYQVSPASVLAYEVAVKASVRLAQPNVAMDALERWARVSTVADIDDDLKTAAELKDFRQSSAYQEWKKTTAAKPAAG